MFKRSAKQKASPSTARPVPKPLTATSASNMHQTSSDGDTANFLNSMNDPEIIERLRCTIKHAHVFKLPPRQTASVGWRGADWKEKVWQGTVRIVDRNNMTAVILVDTSSRNGGDGGNNGGGGTIFAVCPIQEGAVERCIDSSRYFVLRIENQSGRHMFIGVAFNERNDAFDFNTALEDARREREFESKVHVDGKSPALLTPSKPNMFSLKKGEKMRVEIPTSANKKKNLNADNSGGTAAFANFKLDSPETVETNTDPTPSSSKAKTRRSKSRFGSLGGGGGGIALLKPSSRDTPARTQSHI